MKHDYGEIIRNFVYVGAVILAIHGAGHMARPTGALDDRRTGLYIGFFCTVAALLMATVATIGTL